MFTFACSSETLKSIDMLAAQAMLFCTDWCQFLLVGHILATVECQAPFKCYACLAQRGTT